MVCKDCEKKLVGGIHDRPKAGAGAGAAAAASSSSVGGAGSSKALGLNKNSLIGAKKHQVRAMLVQGKCKLCKQNVHQQGHYCQACAYKKGICAMCGKKVLDTKFYKQSVV